MELLKKISIYFITLILVLGCNGEVLEELDSDASTAGNFCPTERRADGTCPESVGGSAPTYTTSNWDFTTSGDYSFDSNYVEVTGGEASLKTVDQTHSGTDFNSGSHVGTYYDSSAQRVKLRTKVDSLSAHVNTILPAKSSNLVGYWRIEGDWSDTSTNGQSGTATAAATFSSSAKVGDQSAVFDGTQAAVSFGDLDTIDFGTGNFSIAFWAKGGVAVNGGIISKDNWAGNGNGLLIYVEGGEYRYWNGTTLFQIGNLCSDWCHIAIVRNGTGANQVEFYFNGLAVGAITDSRTLSNTIPLHFGGTNSTNHFDSELDVIVSL